MERYKAKTKFLQYQLWQDCRNGCKFCSERCQKPIDRKYSLNFVLNKLDDPEVLQYEEIGIIGGEIFDNQIEEEEVRNLLYKITDKISSFTHLKKYYLGTSLIFNIDTYLVPYLKYLRKINMLDKTLLCTSYDTKYRFNSEGKFELWDSNMIRLQKEFPEMQLHVETILTQHFIDSVLNHNFDIKEFCDKYKVRMDFIEPASGMSYNTKSDCEKACPGFFPTKSSFIKFLIQEGVENNNIDLSCMISYQIRASRIYHVDTGDFVCYKDRRIPGFRVQCKDTTKKYELGFIDSDDSMEDVATSICEMIDD